MRTATLFACFLLNTTRAQGFNITAAEVRQPFTYVLTLHYLAKARTTISLMKNGTMFSICLVNKRICENFYEGISLSIEYHEVFLLVNHTITLVSPDDSGFWILKLLHENDVHGHVLRKYFLQPLETSNTFGTNCKQIDDLRSKMICVVTSPTSSETESTTAHVNKFIEDTNTLESITGKCNAKTDTDGLFMACYFEHNSNEDGECKFELKEKDVRIMSLLTDLKIMPPVETEDKVYYMSECSADVSISNLAPGIYHLTVDMFLSGKFKGVNRSMIVDAGRIVVSKPSELKSSTFDAFKIGIIIVSGTALLLLLLAILIRTRPCKKQHHYDTIKKNSEISKNFLNCCRFESEIVPHIYANSDFASDM